MTSLSSKWLLKYNNHSPKLNSGKLRRSSDLVLDVCIGLSHFTCVALTAFHYLINADFCSIELLPGKLSLRECTTWAHTVSRSFEPAIKKNLNEQLFKMGILARRTETESTIFSLTGGGSIIKWKIGEVTRKVPDSVLSSIFVPGYNGIVFEVAVSHTKSDLLTHINEWLDPSFFEVNVVIIILFEGYGLRDEDNKESDIQQMAVTWHVFRRGSLGLPER